MFAAWDVVRIVVIAFFALLLPIGVHYRVRSQATGEPLDRRQEGLFMLATLRPIGAAMWIGAFAWIVNPRLMAWSAVALPQWLRWTGVALMIAGGALLVWTFRSLGRNLTDTVVTRRDHTLVTHGPYRWIRHPLYTSAGLVTVGLSLAAANWFLLLAGGLAVALLVIRTRTEERNLEARFGDAYRGYMKRTGRFLPRM